MTMISERKTFRLPTSSDVCAIYELLLEQELVSFALTADAQHKIESLVSTIGGTYFGVEPYPSLEQKAVAYLYFLIKDHPFVDGNKRTATLTFLTICRVNNLEMNATIRMDELAVAIEKLDGLEARTAVDLLTKILF